MIYIYLNLIEITIVVSQITNSQVFPKNRVPWHIWGRSQNQQWRGSVPSLPYAFWLQELLTACRLIPPDQEMFRHRARSSHNTRIWTWMEDSTCTGNPTLLTLHLRRTWKHGGMWFLGCLLTGTCTRLILSLVGWSMDTPTSIYSPFSSNKSMGKVGDAGHRRISDIKYPGT